MVLPRVVHFCASLGTPRRWSLCLEGLYRKRRSAPLVRRCSARLPTIVHSSALDRRVTAAVPPELCLRVRTALVPAAVPAAYGCVPRGQWAPLDADMFELIDRSSCLVEPVVVVGRAILLLPVLAQTCTWHVQRRVQSLLANTPIAMP